MTDNLRVNGDRLWASLMEMAKIGALPAGGCRRLALSDEDREGRDLFASWCKEAGCTIEIDDFGNMFVRRDGVNNDLPPIAIGSHLDTQPHGGKFDGVYGVLAGLEIIRTLNDAGIETEAPIEVINWTNEEGARFAPAMLSSGVYADLFTREFAFSRTDVDGNTFEDELKRIGYQGDKACGEHEIGYFLEAHIEQGPILEREEKTIGVVRGGQGQRWYDGIAQGQDAHTGSTPMEGRDDALLKAAEFTLAVRDIAHKYAPDAVATVGEMHVEPNSRNTIPGEVRLTVDARNPDDDILTQMDKDLRTAARKTGVEIEQIWHCPPVKFDETCVEAIQQATNKMVYPNRVMVSGAGHDACQVARKIPTAMVFVPCEDGISHNEAESATPEDLEAGANVLLHAALQLAK